MSTEERIVSALKQFDVSYWTDDKGSYIVSRGKDLVLIVLVNPNGDISTIAKVKDGCLEPKFSEFSDVEHYIAALLSCDLEALPKDLPYYL